MHLYLILFSWSKNITKEVQDWGFSPCRKLKQDTFTAVHWYQASKFLETKNQYGISYGLECNSFKWHCNSTGVARASCIFWWYGYSGWVNMIKKQIKHLNLPPKEWPQVIYCGEGGCRQATNTAGWDSWTKTQQSQKEWMYNCLTKPGYCCGRAIGLAKL